MQDRDIALIDELRENSAENTCLEFKKDNIDIKLIGKLCSALSNPCSVVFRSIPTKLPILIE